MHIRALAAALLLGCGAAAAQEGTYGVNHAEHHAWYDSLRNQQTGVSCCHSADCRPTSARLSGEQWYARVDGSWRRVPASAILANTAPDGQAHICTDPSGSQLYCFVRPAFGM